MFINFNYQLLQSKANRPVHNMPVHFDFSIFLYIENSKSKGNVLFCLLMYCFGLLDWKSYWFVCTIIILLERTAELTKYTIWTLLQTCCLIIWLIYFQKENYFLMVMSPFAEGNIIAKSWMNIQLLKNCWRLKGQRPIKKKWLKLY